jgi:hypothetical protein
MGYGRSVRAGACERTSVNPQFNVDARVNDFRILVHDELEAVEDFLQSCCQASGVELIDEVWQHLLQARGKRLRPILLLLSPRPTAASPSTRSWPARWSR